MGVVIGKQPREQVMRLVQTALATDDDAGWERARQSFAAETDATYVKAASAQAPRWWQKWIDEPRAQYDRHAQVIFRVRDQDGRAVEHFDVFFDSESTPQASELPIRALFEDKHVKDVTPNVIAFYLRLDAYEKQAATWVPRLPKVRGVYLEVSAVEPETDQVLYLPLRYELDPQSLVDWIQPYRTTIIDVELFRLPSDQVFLIVPG